MLTQQVLYNAYLGTLAAAACVLAARHLTVSAIADRRQADRRDGDRRGPDRRMQFRPRCFERRFAVRRDIERRRGDRREAAEVLRAAA